MTSGTFAKRNYLAEDSAASAEMTREGERDQANAH